MRCSGDMWTGPLLTPALCDSQETVNVAFRLSPSPAATALTQALAAAPRLHTLHTQLPAVWNTTLLDVRLFSSISLYLSPAVVSPESVAFRSVFSVLRRLLLLRSRP